MIIVTHTHTVTHTGTAKNVFRVELNKKKADIVLELIVFILVNLKKQKWESEIRGRMPERYTNGK